MAAGTASGHRRTKAASGGRMSGAIRLHQLRIGRWVHLHPVMFSPADALTRPPSLLDEVSDAVAVLDAAGSESATVFTYTGGGMVGAPGGGWCGATWHRGAMAKTGRQSEWTFCQCVCMTCVTARRPRFAGIRQRRFLWCTCRRRGRPRSFRPGTECWPGARPGEPGVLVRGRLRDS